MEHTKDLLIYFEVTKIVYKNAMNHYFVIEASCQLGNNESIQVLTITGTLDSIKIGTFYKGIGNFIIHEKYGRQFILSSIEEYKKVEETYEVKFEVKKIRFRNEDTYYSIIEAEWLDYSYEYIPTTELIIVGNFLSVLVEDEFTGVGKWINDKTYGYQFRLESCQRVMPQSIKGIKAFLTRFVKGLGNKTADLIVNYYKEDTIAKIEESIENLLIIPGIGKKKAEKIYEKISKNCKMEETSVFVISNGFGYRMAEKIYRAYGQSSIMRVKENPYCLCDVDKIGFIVADTFANNLNFKSNYSERIYNGILHYMKAITLNRGDLYVYKEILVDGFIDYLNNYGRFEKNNVTKKDVLESLKHLISDEKIIIDVDAQNKECVYLKNYNIIENKIVTFLKRLIIEDRHPIAHTDQITFFLEDYRTRKNMTLANNQKKAVYMALKSGVSILTGGPGTGKTQTINTIIQCITSINPNSDIRLAAPTGKASIRMTELTGMESQTIHRLIGLNGFDVGNQTESLKMDFLIVDESSMIDAYVFYKLLNSVDSDTRILFVGDHEQLPSVGPGLILRDLINSCKIPTTKLTEIFRQAKESQIVMNSHKVIDGKKTIDKDGLTFDHSKGDFYFIERKDRIQVQRTIIESVSRLIKNGSKLSDIQILSPMRKGDLGIDILNKLMQQNFNPASNNKFEVKINASSILREGDRVIQITNNYELGVFNGEVGIIDKIYYNDNDDIELIINYDNKTVIYSEEYLDELQLAYVITIHKSQGSEFPVVIMPIHSSQEFMLNKNMIYTGLSRAKKSVVLIGSKETLDNAICKKDVVQRNSKIKEKLIRNIPIDTTIYISAEVETHAA